jgi:hypothetical protein
VFQIIADGIAWVDSDGLDNWPAFETEALAAVLEDQGYDIGVVAL